MSCTITVVACEVCDAAMNFVKAHYECPRCRWIKPCCEPDMV